MLETTEQRTDFETALGRRLVADGRLDDASLERARRLCVESGERLERVLTKLGMVTERDLAAALAGELGVRLAQARDFPDHKVVDAEVSARFLRESQVVPIAEDDAGIALAMVDPLDDYAVKAMELIAGRPVTPWVATAIDIEAAIERLYGEKGATIGQIVDEAEDGGDVADDDIDRLRDLASEAPVIRLVNLLIGRAVESRASDVHIEPFESALRVRYRIDGVLREVEAPPSRFSAAVISRVKIMARLNIAERRLPQDGRVKLAIRGKDIDLRVSTVPTMHGESVVLRVLDRGQVFDLTSLGFDDEVMTGFQNVLAQPHGIVIVTGPTGSGKTTTLYAALLQLNSPERKILTVEDPIEYQLEGVNQVQVQPQIDLTFANVLRSLLRQDPDVIMIGEIRDVETAEIAVQAALTGHVVLSTLHTNNAATTIPRLLDMGMEDYLLTSTVNAVVAQRLVRTLCLECRRAEPALPGLVDQLGIRRFADTDTIIIHKAVGCEACNGTGYFGRTTVLELMAMNDAVRAKVLERAEANEIEKTALETGMRSMFEDGIRKALAGVTSIEEVLRATRIT
jgi:general secretion pathway protein E